MLCLVLLLLLAMLLLLLQQYEIWVSIQMIKPGAWTSDKRIQECVFNKLVLIMISLLKRLNTRADKKTACNFAPHLLAPRSRNNHGRMLCEIRHADKLIHVDTLIQHQQLVKSGQFALGFTCRFQVRFRSWSRRNLPHCILKSMTN